MVIIGKNNGKYILEASMEELYRLNNLEGTWGLAHDPPLGTEFKITLKIENTLNDFKRIKESHRFSLLKKEIDNLSYEFSRVEDLYKKTMK